MLNFNFRYNTPVMTLFMIFRVIYSYQCRNIGKGVLPGSITMGSIYNRLLTNLH